MKTAFDLIRFGDRVTIRTPHGQTISGRATIFNQRQDLWVLNAGGRYGTPAIATRENLVLVKPRAA